MKHFHGNSKNLQILNKLGSLQNLLTKSIAESKRNYFYRMADKLHNTEKGSNAYWPLLKRFLNNKKIPLIPPIFHDNEFEKNKKKKKKKGSQQIFSRMNEKRLYNAIFSIEEIGNIIQGYKVYFQQSSWSR